MLLIFANRCINIYIKVDESGVKGWKVDKVDNFVDNEDTEYEPETRCFRWRAD